MSVLHPIEFQQRLCRMEAFNLFNGQVNFNCLLESQRGKISSVYVYVTLRCFDTVFWRPYLTFSIGF